MQQFFDYSDEVKNAMNAKKPILALESTLITHGLPHPYNFDIALEVEDITRSFDVTPATIAILNGKIKIGLVKEELEQLINGNDCIKSSTRELAYVLSKGMSAGTTVAATAFCAHHAGIKIFATGGIGGVHRGEGLDISADLNQLTKTPIAVVCSGAKAILDLAKTMEYLETFGIPIVGYQTTLLPAFYTSDSQYHLPISFNDLKTIRDYLHLHWQFNPKSGVLIANPISKTDEIPNSIIEPAIQSALVKAKEKNITGKAITPFLLNAIREITENKSLNANLSLIKNNVRLGAELAQCFDR